MPLRAVWESMQWAIPWMVGEPPTSLKPHHAMPAEVTDAVEGHLACWHLVWLRYSHANDVGNSESIVLRKQLEPQPSVHRVQQQQEAPSNALWEVHAKVFIELIRFAEQSPSDQKAPHDPRQHLCCIARGLLFPSPAYERPKVVLDQLHSVYPGDLLLVHEQVWLIYLLEIVLNVVKHLLPPCQVLCPLLEPYDSPHHLDPPHPRPRALHGSPPLRLQ
mmetsp:Transcript_147506/g.383508  ORF Transcript_147506/g.383508 Transcript_147506/m.383508 type:complete len:218 (+) Transcript_147506:3222-3875(+)